MASIRKKSNSSYQIVVSQGYDLQGKKIQKTTTYKPKATTPKAIEKEVRAFAQKFEEQVRSGNYLEGEKITLNDFVNEWFNNWAVQHLTKSVQEQYMYQLEKKVLPKIGHMILTKIKPVHVQSIITEMGNKGYAVKSIKYMYTALNSVLKHAYNMEVIDRNPCDRCELPKSKPKTEGQSFTRNQAVRFLRYIGAEIEREDDPRSDSGKVIQMPKRVESAGADADAKVTRHYLEGMTSLQYGCYFNLAIYGGLRRGEMIALTWNDIDFETGKITVNKAVARTKSGQIVKEPKTKNGTRTFKLPASCIRSLKQWKKHMDKLAAALGSRWEGFGCYDAEREEVSGDNNVFIDCYSGKQMNIDAPSHKIKEIIDGYNETVKDDDKLPLIRLHDLRHTTVSMLQSRGVDVVTIAHRMGHDPSVTLGVYAHPLDEMDEKAADVLEELFAVDA